MEDEKSEDKLLEDLLQVGKSTAETKKSE